MTQQSSWPPDWPHDWPAPQGSRREGLSILGEGRPLSEAECEALAQVTPPRARRGRGTAYPEHWPWTERPGWAPLIRERGAAPDEAWRHARAVPARTLSRLEGLRDPRRPYSSDHRWHWSAPEDWAAAELIESPVVQLHGQVRVYEEDDGNTHVTIGERDPAEVLGSTLMIPQTFLPNYPGGWVPPRGMRADLWLGQLEDWQSRHVPPLNAAWRLNNSAEVGQVRSIGRWRQSEAPLSEITGGQSNSLTIGGHDVLARIAEHEGQTVTLWCARGPITLNPSDLGEGECLL